MAPARSRSWRGDLWPASRRPVLYLLSNSRLWTSALEWSLAYRRLVVHHVTAAGSCCRTHVHPRLMRAAPHGKSPHLLQEAHRRLRPVQLKIELELHDGGDGSAHPGTSITAVAAAAVTAADAGGGGNPAAGKIAGGPSARALQQALSHGGGGGGGGNGQAADVDTSHLRHTPTLRRIVSGLHHTGRHINKANPFRGAIRSLSRRPETGDGFLGPSVIYEVRTATLAALAAVQLLLLQWRQHQLRELNADAGVCRPMPRKTVLRMCKRDFRTGFSIVPRQDALLVIGTELLDLHLAADAVSESEEDAALAAGDAALAAGDAGEQQASRSFTGPAGLRLAKVHSLLRLVLALPLRQYGRAAGRALLYWALYETSQYPVRNLSKPFQNL